MSHRIIKDIIEGNPTCFGECKCEDNRSFWRKIKDGIRYTRPRRWIGRKILGNPRRGQGILVQVDLKYKTKDEVEAFWKAMDYLSKAGISCDSSYGGKYDLEFDWSLEGAIATCKKCGYNSVENKWWIDYWEKKEHFTTTCDGCGEELDYDEGFRNVKKHFWNKTKYYHTNCHGGTL